MTITADQLPLLLEHLTEQYSPVIGLWVSGFLAAAFAIAVVAALLVIARELIT